MGKGKGRPKGLYPEILIQVAGLLREGEEVPSKELIRRAKERYGLASVTLLKYLKHLVSVGLVSETHRGKRVFYRKLIPDPSPRSTGNFQHDLRFLARTMKDLLEIGREMPEERREKFLKTASQVYLLPITESLLQRWGRANRQVQLEGRAPKRPLGGDRE